MKVTEVQLAASKYWPYVNGECLIGNSHIADPFVAGMLAGWRQGLQTTANESTFKYFIPVYFLSWEHVLELIEK